MSGDEFLNKLNEVDSVELFLSVFTGNENDGRLLVKSMQNEWEDNFLNADYQAIKKGLNDKDISQMTDFISVINIIEDVKGQNLTALKQSIVKSYSDHNDKIIAILQALINELSCNSDDCVEARRDSYMEQLKHAKEKDEVLSLARKMMDNNSL